MAFDTAQKRASVVSHGRPWKRPSVIPDGSFDQADRQQIGNTYAGILVGLPFILPKIASIALTMRSRKINLSMRSRSVSLKLK